MRGISAGRDRGRAVDMALSRQLIWACLAHGGANRLSTLLRTLAMASAILLSPLT